MLCLSTEALSAQIKSVEREIDCLAKTIYHEARGESEIGKKAIAVVIMNRVNSPEFPNSICHVVYEPGQFTWALDKKAKIKDQILYKEIHDLATSMYYQYHVKRIIPKCLVNLSNALYFSTRRFNNKKLKFIAKIGDHRFYSLRQI
jgi:spore germination cell wall hydrolase CwlJ-like protein